MKPVVDTKAPKTFQLIRKEMEVSSNSARIESDNKRLRQRLGYIYTHPGKVDNHNEYKIKSLNAPKKRQEVERLRVENAEFKRRLKERTKPRNERKWESDWVETLSYMNNASRYPLCLVRKARSQDGVPESEGPRANMIRPFVETVGDEALKQVSDVDPNRMIIDFADPLLKEDPHYCELKRQGPREDVPEGVRGFVASVIQTALHRVYEYDLSKESKVKPSRVSDNDEFLPKSKKPVELVETPEHGGLKSPFVNDESSVVNCEKTGKHPIGWQVDESWLHCTDILSEEDTPYDVLYRYRVRWSVPTRRAPIPQATASIYFTIKVSKIKPKMQDVDVYYQVETFRTKHKPGETRFCEQWLRGVIDSKLRLMPYVTF
ncbi:hypothetical protein X801_03810 [Opisthorchis viverrini]|uniref:A-kinase anchor protein 14 n=1 Tax=Opisthorchis viverrini TaxID=6198 RepID=A0A1S8X0R7_OPIVI|nr:hypothetical protein X801_03810 [Opisthorchis viverrini]